MKKFLSVMLAVLMVFSMMSVLAFADGEKKSKTEEFIAQINKGFVVTTTGELNASVAVDPQNNKAAFDMTIGSFDAKVRMEGKSIKAYVSPLFKADVSSLIYDLTGTELEVADFKEALDKVSEVDLSELMEFCDVTFENNVEKFTPNYDKIKEVVAESITDQAEKQALILKNETEFLEYCRNLQAGQPGKTEFDNCMKCGGEVTFTGSDAKTITNIKVTYPTNDFKATKTIQMSDITVEGIKIKSISVNVTEDVFDTPTGIFDVTWLLKLFINFLISKVG